MTTLKLNAPAKINLYLEVISRRLDGYHNIESVMQTVDLFDTLTFTRRERDDRGIILECDDKRVPLDEKNLVCRAAKLFFEHTRTGEADVTVHLEKRIPMAAGLGGGSSDAATTLLALNKLYDSRLSIDELCTLGARIGADVPFCVRQGIAVTRGIGEICSPCAPLPDCFIVIACAGEGVSTPWAYARLDEMYDYDTRAVSSDKFVGALEGGDITLAASEMTNIFESVVLDERAVARRIRDTLSDVGALKAMMSGSGPSVFGLFADEASALLAVTALKKQGITARLTKPYYPAI